MMWPALFYADYVRDRGKDSFSIFSTLLLLTTCFLKYNSLFFSFLLLGWLCLPFLALLAVFAKVIAVTNLLAFCV